MLIAHNLIGLDIRSDKSPICIRSEKSILFATLYY